MNQRLRLASGFAVFVAALVLGCSGPSDDTGDDQGPTFNAAENCRTSRDCTSCKDGFVSRQMTSGTLDCVAGPKTAIQYPVVSSMRLLDATSPNEAALPMDASHMYRVEATTNVQTPDAGYTVWARAWSTKRPSEYLCTLATIPGSAFQAQGGAYVGASRPFAIDNKCITAIQDIEKSIGRRISKVSLEVAFDVDNRYELHDFSSANSASGPFGASIPVPPQTFDLGVIPWQPRSAFTPTKKIKPAAGYDGGLDTQGMAVVASGDPDEAAFLSQRAMSRSERRDPYTRTTKGPGNKVFTLKSNIAATLTEAKGAWFGKFDNVGAWGGNHFAPEIFEPAIQGFDLDSSVLQVNYNLSAKNNFTDLMAPSNERRPHDLIGRVTWFTRGATPSNVNWAFQSSMVVGARFFIRPADGGDWKNVHTEIADNPAPSALVPTNANNEFLLSKGLSVFPRNDTFSLRFANGVRKLFYKEWSNSTSFDLALCPVNRTPLTVTDAWRLAGNVTGAPDDNCAIRRIRIERLPLGASTLPPTTRSANGGASGRSPSGDDSIGTAQTGGTTSSCTPMNGTNRCNTDQRLGFQTSGTFAANIADSTLTSTADEEGDNPAVTPPSLELFGFNLLAGLSGDKVSDGQGSITFPIGAWIQSYLMRNEKPRPPGSTIQTKAFRPGERQGIAFVFEKPFPPLCGVWGCVQVVASIFAGLTLDADLKITALRKSTQNPIPCVGGTNTRCFVATPRVTGTLAKAAQECGKFGGKVAHIRDAAEQVKAVAAVKKAVDDYNNVATNPRVTAKPWIGLEKTAAYLYDPLFCQSVAAGGAPTGACVKDEPTSPDLGTAPCADPIIVKWGTEPGQETRRCGSLSIDPTVAQCRSYCAGSTFFGMARTSASTAKCYCGDSYGRYGTAPSTECDATCTGGSACGKSDRTRTSVYTVDTSIPQATIDRCRTSTTAAWSFAGDGTIVRTLQADGTWRATTGLYDNLNMVKPEDKYAVLNVDSGKWDSVSDGATNFPLCEYDRADRAGGIGIDVTFTPALVAGGSLAIIYGNRYVVGIGIKLTVNFISVAMPVNANFYTVKFTRGGTTQWGGGAGITGSLNISFLSGSLGAVLYTAFHDWEFPIFNFSGIVLADKPLFKKETTWAY